MNKTLSSLVGRLGDKSLIEANVIPWSCPVPAFGDPDTARYATLGLNPSNREFVDSEGIELAEHERRFHTLRSLGLKRWSQARDKHVGMIAGACRGYFRGNPYDTWFRRLDYLMGDAGATYYGVFQNACHLDLIPYATECKWTDLTSDQRDVLFARSANAFGELLRDSPIRLLILNGRSVVEQFERAAEVTLDQAHMRSWALPRKSGIDVRGIAYSGTVRKVAGVRLKRELSVVGYNHNIQSSFGVTKDVLRSIREWLGKIGQRAG